MEGRKTSSLLLNGLFLLRNVEGRYLFLVTQSYKNAILIFQVLFYIKAICLNEDVKARLYMNRTLCTAWSRRCENYCQWLFFKKGRGRGSRRYKPADCLHRKTWWYCGIQCHTCTGEADGVDQPATVLLTAQWTPTKWERDPLSRKDVHGVWGTLDVVLWPLHTCAGTLTHNKTSPVHNEPGSLGHFWCSLRLLPTSTS